MDKNNRNFSNIALGVGGVALLASLAFWFVQRDFTLPVQISIGLAVIGLALFVYFDPDRARALFTGRQARYGSNTLLLLIAFIGIVVVINYLVFQNATDWGLRWDLTEDKERTLSDETLAALEQVAALDEALIVQAFFTSQHSGQTSARDLLEDFEFHTGDKLVYEFVDPVANPIAAQQAAITQDGTLVFLLGANIQKVTVATEQEFTNAIVQLLNPNNKAVYFLTGHGEYNVDQSGQDSLNLLRAALENKNYIVSSLNLLVEPAVPDDAVAIVIAGATQPVTAAEVSAIQSFLNSGGALIVAQDPRAQTEFSSADDLLRAYLIDSWGITLGDNIAIEPQVIETLQGLYAASVTYAQQEITTDLNQRGMSTVFPVASSVTVSNPAIPDVTQTELILTSEESWAETNVESINDGTLALDEQDLAGPFSLAVAAENGVTGSRVVVFGDSEFLADGAITSFGNQDLITNSVDWASRQEALITLTPRSTTQRFIAPPTQSTIYAIALGTVCIVPGLVLLGGVWVWASRRRKG